MLSRHVVYRQWRISPPVCLPAWGQDFQLFKNTHFYSDLAGDKSTILDIDHPDLETFPEFIHATPYECHLEPGDVLFIPGERKIQIQIRHLHTNRGKHLSTVCGPVYLRRKFKSTEKHCILYRSPPLTLHFSIANAAYQRKPNIICQQMAQFSVAFSSN